MEYITIQDYFDSIGPMGSMRRLKAIAIAGLGLRSEAAKRACEKRIRRKELLLMGFAFSTVKVIVDEEFSNNQQK